MIKSLIEKFKVATQPPYSCKGVETPKQIKFEISGEKNGDLNLNSKTDLLFTAYNQLINNKNPKEKANEISRKLTSNSEFKRIDVELNSRTALISIKEENKNPKINILPNEIADSPALGLTLGIGKLSSTLVYGQRGIMSIFELKKILNFKSLPIIKFTTKYENSDYISRSTSTQKLNITSNIDINSHEFGIGFEWRKYFPHYNASWEVRKSSGISTKVFLNHKFNYSNLNKINPSKGFQFQIINELATGDVNFIKNLINFSGFYSPPFFGFGKRKLTLGLSTSLGFLYGKYIIDDKIFIGGPLPFRGINGKSFGEKVPKIGSKNSDIIGTNKYLISSLFLHYPLIKNLNILGFITSGSYDFKNFLISSGIGFSYNLKGKRIELSLCNKLKSSTCFESIKLLNFSISNYLN